MPDPFVGRSGILSDAAFGEAVRRLGIDAARLWAVLTVETRGFGFLPDRRPKILFERHVFHRRTGGRFSANDPEVSSPGAGGYRGGGAEYARLARAMALDRRAALESASWGLPQLMGFHAASLRYRDVEELVAGFIDGEDAQLDGAVRFIAANAALADALRARKWATVAFYYNGKNYAKNAYDVKLARYHDLYAAGRTPSLEVRAAQARLTFLGYDPRGVDGVLGHGTRAAALAFQKATGLPATSDLDDATQDRLRVASGV